MKTVFLPFIITIICVGCASDKVYIDSEKVPGLGVMVEFPSGKILPIEVRRVIAGNIIELTNNERVVYIGVYIPQLYDIAGAAKSFNERVIEGEQIRLEFDKGQRDPKGRLLAYAYTLKGKFINAEIIREGLGKVLITPPNIKYKEELLRAEEEARIKERGVWSKDLGKKS